MTEPLIWTTKGNLPMKDLTCKRYWQDMPDVLMFVEEYWMGEEMVKRGAHGYLKHGVPIGTEGGL